MKSINIMSKTLA